MQAKNEILEELRSLSTVIDKISRQTPYGLPEGYFNDFPDFMMRRLMGGPLSAAVGPSDPFPSPSPSPFQVPEGYFEGFAGGVLARIKAQGMSGGQTAGFASEAGSGVTNGSDEVSAELAMLSPLLSRLERLTPYQAPEGYFEELVPILAGLQHKPLYAVPDGYFEGLAGEMAARIAQEDQDPIKTIPAAPARVIPIGRRGAWWRYSAAAVVAGLVLTIGWLRLHTSGRNGAPVDVAHSLYTVSDQEIQNYLDNHNNIIPPAEQDSTLNSTAALNVDENDGKNLLGDVPDGELKQYLEEHGATKDAATN